MRRRPRSTGFARLGLLGLLSLICLGAFASPATAKMRPAKAGGGKVPLENIRIALRGTNGHPIAVGSYTLGNSPKVAVSVRDGHAWAEYSVPASVTSTRVVASFGHFGRIDLRFHPSGQVQRHRQRNCNGSISVLKRRLGIFTGTIRFRGENSYTEVSATRVKGSVGNPLVGLGFDGTPSCDSEPRQKRIRTVQMSASASDPDRNFDALAPPEARTRTGKEARVVFIAGTAESIGRVSIYRTVIVGGPPGDFLFDDGTFRSATVTPPPPFAGSATFTRNPDGSTSWTGTLGVSLPGQESVALTGPEFEGELGVLGPLSYRDAVAP